MNSNFDGFIEIPFGYKNLDRYYVRTSILEAIENTLDKFSGNLLDVGCGKMPYRQLIKARSKINSYTGVDIETAIQYDAFIKPDYHWDGITMPFDDKSFETVIATEVLEHCPDPLATVSEIYRVMNNNSLFFFTVPFLWNLHEVPHDEYRYTPFSLERILKNAGFINIEIKALGGWNASMAQMIGLWIRRAPMSNTRRKIFSVIVKPLVKKLIQADIKPKDFHEGQMVTGLVGIARK